MSIERLLDQWDGGGALSVEFRQLKNILEVHGFTIHQIKTCFGVLTDQLGMTLATELERNPTLEEYRGRLQELFSNEERIIAKCKGAIPSSKRVAQEV